MIKCIKRNSLSKLTHNVFRHYIYETLNNRDVIEINGEDSKLFLQGLTSNDVNCGLKSFNSLYSLFLNAKGRVLFDVILYNNISQKMFIECDKSISDSLMKHIQLYKLRKKVDIMKISTAQVSIIIPESPSENIESLKIHENNTDLVYFGSDPRIRSWVIRMLTLKNIPVQSLIPIIKQGSDNCYLESRLRHGICEGAIDFKPGEVLPLEHNGDIMHGISFNKGCYIGQELTARTHHTGVVRKRVMPIRIDGNVTELSARVSGMNLFSDETKTVSAGVIKSLHENGSGLAIIRLSSLKFDKHLPDKGRQFRPLFLDGCQWPVIVRSPGWWPEDIVLPGSE